MATLISWLQDPANRWIEPRDLDAYIRGNPAIAKTVNTPGVGGVTPLVFVAGKGEGDMANILISRYGAKKSKTALDAYNAFVKENPDENDAETQTWMRKMIGARRKMTRRLRRRTTRRRRAFTS